MGGPEVIIVGAGAAGLAAAHEVGAAGKSVLVLEARDRIGGRVLTARDPRLAFPIELGPEFIHGRPPSTWAWVKRLGLTAIDLPFHHHQRRRGRVVRLDDFSAEMEPVMNGLAHLGPRDKSFVEYLRSHRGGGADARRLAVAFIEGFDAADPAMISAKSLAGELQTLGDVSEQTQFRLLEGYGELIDRLHAALDARRVRIRLGVTVREVRWERGAVELRCAAKDRGELTLTAPRVILTLPVGVLQAAYPARGAVRFIPDLPAKRRAIHQLGSGSVVKVVMVFTEAFWESAAAARASRAGSTLRDAVFMHNPGAAFPTCWTSIPLRTPVLTAWAGGPRALALAGAGPDAQVDAALRSAAELLGMRAASVRSRLVRARVKDWHADPFARGAYSYVAVGGEKARAELARSERGTLYFAGEAADTSGQASTVAGALASGRAAARAVLQG